MLFYNFAFPLILILKFGTLPNPLLIAGESPLAFWFMICGVLISFLSKL